MHGQFGLDLEAAGENRKRFDEAARKHPIAGEDIGEGAAENVGDKAGQQPVAGAMAGAIGRFFADRPGVATTISSRSARSLSIIAGALGAS